MAPGSKPRRAARGFTLLELIVAVTIMAVAAGAVALALGNRSQADLEREAQQLAGLLEGARAEARAAGVDVRWRAQPGDGSGPFLFLGLPGGAEQRLGLPRGWLGDPPAVDIQAPPANAGMLRLGPEPLIGAQRVRLSRDGRSITLATDGLSPFTALREATP